MSAGFSFGTTPQPTFGLGSGGGNFNFGGATSNTGLGGSLFGAGNTQNTSTLGLGAGNPTNTSGGFTLGSAGTLFSTASFPTTTTTPSLFSGFGAGATSTSKPAFALGLTSTPANVPASTGGFLGFGTTPTASTAATTGLGFGGLGQSFLSGTTTTAPFGGFGAGLTAATSGLGLGTSVVPSLTTSVGLGGVDLSQTASGDITSTGVASKVDNKAVKEILVPNEILTTVEIVKKYVKEQKNMREEITRISSKPLFKVQEETDTLKQMLCDVNSGIHRNVAIIEKLKQETAQELKFAEIAQRTNDTPPGLQYENTAPTEYFQNMIVVFENRMQLYRQKIEQMEKHLTALSQSSMLTPQELTLAMKRIHETFIALAAQLQIVHEAVKTQKEQYLNYRKVFHGDNVNIFEIRNSQSVKTSMPDRARSIIGPTPFSGLANATAAAMASALNRMQQPTGGPPPTLGFAVNSGSLGSGLYSSSNLGIGGTFNSSAGGLSNSSLSFGGSNISAIKPLGSGSGFGLNYDSMSSLGGSSFGGGTVASSGYNSAPATPLGQKQPFQLQKPPQGSKRGKRVAHN